MSERFALLLGQDLTELEAAATAWRRLADHCEEARQRHRATITAPLSPAHWQGAEADLGRQELLRTEQRLGRVRTEAAAVAGTLDTVHEQLTLARRELRSAVGAAERGGFRVDDDGLVAVPSAAPGPLPEPRGAELARCRAELAKAVTRAEAASEEGSRTLARLGGELLGRPRQFGTSEESCATARTDAGPLGSAPPEHRGPAENRAWWEALTPDQQLNCLALHPEQVGALDGVPSAVRDTANRAVLAHRLREAEAAEDWSQLAALGSLATRLSAQEPPAEGRRLLLVALDPAGEGKAVISVGDPDTARNTAVYVPGTGARLSRVNGDLDRVQRLVAASEKYGSPGDTAAVLWLGYDAPETVLRDATRDRFARQGAPALERYVDGLHTTGPAGQHLTVLGHSYGSTLVGEAARRPGGLAVDDIVVAGSPGMHVQHATDLHLDRPHVWAAGADGDPVIDAGLVHGGRSWPELPNVPTSPAFGANIIETGSAHGHSQYWDEEPGGGRPNESLENQARIITGRYHQTTLRRGTRPPDRP